jgi:hypothetical protein
LQSDEEDGRQKSKPKPVRFGEMWMGKVQAASISSVLCSVSNSWHSTKARIG